MSRRGILMKMLFRYSHHLSQKICIGVVLILLCTLAVTLFANSQITRRIYLREQREYLRKIGDQLKDELRTGMSPDEVIQNIENKEKVLIAYSVQSNDPEILANELRDSFRQKGMGFHKLWLWEQDYIAATQNGVRFRLYGQEKMNYSILVEYLSLDSGLYAIAAIVPEAQRFIEIINHIGFLIDSLSILTAILLIFLLAQHIIHPLTEIQAFTRKVSSHEFQPLQIKTGDELEDVANSLNEMAQNIEKYNRLLEEKNEQMKHLLRNVAHDLKTPIALIGMYSSGIKDGLDDGTFLDTIIHQNDKISQIVEKLLYLSRIEQKEYPCMELELDTVLQSCIEEQEILFKSRNLTLFPKIEHHVRIYGNPELLSELLSNLLSNAAKYASSDFVNVELYQKEHSCVFHISNETEDISLDINSIWQPFYVGEKSRNKELSGTGLGLSIVKNIAERFGYTISCKQNENKIVFEILFPLL